MRPSAWDLSGHHGSREDLEERQSVQWAVKEMPVRQEPRMSKKQMKSSVTRREQTGRRRVGDEPVR